MKSLLTYLVAVFAVCLIASCSPISDEDIAPDVKKEKFEVEYTKGGSEPDPGDPGDD